MAIPIYKNGSNKLRMILYPAGLLLAAALTWVGWVHEPEADASQRLASAEMLVRSGAFEAARTEVEIVLNEEPEHLHGLLVLGLLEERQLHEARAIRAYERARDLTDDAGLRRDIDLSLVDLERRLRRFEEARRRLGDFERRNGSEVATERLAGLIDWESGDRERALSRFEAAHALEPGNTELTLLLAGAFIEAGRAADARQLLESMPATMRESSGSWKELARLYLESGDENGAFEALSRCTELDGAASRRLGRDEFWSSFREHRLFGRFIGG